VVSASYGALVQSSSRRARILDTDVRVGDYRLDSTHAIRSDDFDYSSAMNGHAVTLPLSDDPGALRSVAWLETDRRYKEAAERLVKVKTQRTLKVADEDPSDDFSHEKPVNYIGQAASIEVDVPAWEQKIRDLSARFRGQDSIYDSQVTLQVVTHTRWLLNSEGSVIQTGRNYVRVFLQAETRADDGMELERFESYDAASFDSLDGVAEMQKGADSMIADLKSLRKAPLADPYIGPAILEGRAAGVFFHEIFGHRVEGHRQKNEDEGQTFAKKIGEPVMPAFVSVYDDPTLSRIGGVDLNGFYRFDDEAVTAQRATLVDRGVLTGFLLSRSPTRGFHESNGHGRRQEGRAVVSRQGNLVVQTSVVVPVDELRRQLREEAKRQGKAYGLLFRDISGGFTNTTRTGPQSFKVLPILVYRVWADGRPDELVRGVDLVGTPLASLSRILASGNDYQTFNGYCGAESGFVPVSATSPSLLVQQIEIERRDKGSEKPPVLPAPALRARMPLSSLPGATR
jgi:predicted Zn-dependent protease